MMAQEPGYIILKVCRLPILRRRSSDCLHDDGILYAKKLREAGVEVTLNETKGTMHGFDIMQKAETTKAALAARIAFMKKVFESDN